MASSRSGIPPVSSPRHFPANLATCYLPPPYRGVDELGAVISAEFLGRDKEFYLEDLDLNILIASEGGALTKGNVIVVPEPSTWLMLGLGSLLLVGWRQAKRSGGRESEIRRIHTPAGQASSGTRIGNNRVLILVLPQLRWRLLQPTQFRRGHWVTGGSRLCVGVVGNSFQVSGFVHVKR